MQFFLSNSAALAIIAFSTLNTMAVAAPAGAVAESSFGLPAPTPTPTPGANPQNPTGIDFGVLDTENIVMKGNWVAWVADQDSCTFGADLGVKENEASPCGRTFTLPGLEGQYSLQGCGLENNMWLTRDDKQVGTCTYDGKNSFGCAGENPNYLARRWRCAFSDEFKMSLNSK
ncbi:hypothetical protein BU24DRAFT_423053 [Aaosphaeria arxii CBS 175.79]|uniref:Uncharacterized protein n=1 Tax=Aaosphaeria arxii CBS 175.79 TaxID=1450172 RepID=A0A6A5XVM1_9PLEO|nr:uncharacterized protein BU24DRAFT_423053 [Aaosphaeria arxii CBS 175.79]KAF2016680.1 hypothetical protein BU24DRAFT_423053 [Aaosphaeria arxii CBS 175.79]